MLFKTVAVALVLLGEAFCVVAELLASKTVGAGHYLATFIQMSALIAVGGVLLVAGYMLGYIYFKNIWILVVASLATLAIVEPLLAYLWFSEAPTTGALIGLVLAILALLATLFIP